MNTKNSVTLQMSGPKGEEDFLPQKHFEKTHTAWPGGDEDNHGFGWAVFDRQWAEGTALFHGGSNKWWLAQIWVAPNADIAMLAATNGGDEKASEALDRVFQEFLSM